ncbi:TAXI family TRAP transporter solute-binding subunit [Pseudorhodoplanes sp.]|uniref:TAXI family TRAP transporter solute-binding subunit n=1 Tax=Pseudorhodoplanes sp. TaxID=1934341 RepID=UPI002C30760D|nr:TAXI family TRAP transporter solute-binding subunit [Pseudorhodoplanes sp.]HWV55523.1 TAXI family TRAP transporter solute-binding subunit [Pseudorhodoplanes sp.]
MRSLIAAVAACFALSTPVVIAPAHAQNIPEALKQTGNSESAVKEKRNAWAVGVAGGLMSGTYMTFANELARALDDGDNLRILPIVTYGAASNIDDLLYLRGVDIAVTQSDVFEYFKNERKISNLNNRIHYIIRLPVSEVHILAKRDIKSLEDLRGKKVSFGPAGAGSSLTGTIIFQRLGIQVEQLNIDEASGMQKLRSGEISALVRLVGKPIDFFAKIPADANLHLLPIPFSKKFADYYTIGEFSADQYPTLMPEGQNKIDTIAVPAVLAAFNWSKGSDRQKKIERVVERMFTNWSKFQKPPFHPKWRDVNLAATVPGWTRLESAERELQKLQAQAPAANASPDLNRDFQAYLKNADTKRDAQRTPQSREALFAEFLAWRDRQEAMSANNQAQPSDSRPVARSKSRK